MSRRKFREEEKEWLRQNAESDKYKNFDEVYADYVKLFGNDKSCANIKELCSKRLGLSRARFSKNGHFQVGAKPKYAIGDEVIKYYDGQPYLWIKVSDKYFKGIMNSKDYMENWIPKQRYVYEQAYGEIPKDHLVVFLDNNPMNCDIENLYCISRKTNAVMNKNRWFTDRKENTLTAIKWCELFYATKRLRESATE